MNRLCVYDITANGGGGCWAEDILHYTSEYHHVRHVEIMMTAKTKNEPVVEDSARCVRTLRSNTRWLLFANVAYLIFSNYDPPDERCKARTWWVAM